MAIESETPSRILKGIQAIRRALLLAGVGVTPLLFTPFVTLDPVNVPKLAFLTAILGLALGLRLLEWSLGRIWMRSSGVLIPAAFICIPLTIAWSVSPYRSWSLLGQYQRFQGLLPYLLLAAFGILLADAFFGRSHQIAWTLCGSAALMGAYSIVQAFRLDPVLWDTYMGSWGLMTASSTVGNPNFAGAFFAMTLPVGIGLAIHDRSRRLLVGLLMFFAGAGWLLSFSEGAWVAGAAGIAICISWVSARAWRSARRWGAIAAAVAGALLVGSVLASVWGPSAIPGGGFTAEQRAWEWEAAVEMATEHPLLGRGPNAFAIEGVRYRSPQAALNGTYVGDDPHSVPLAFLTSAGLLGLLGFLGAFVWVGRRAIQEGTAISPLGAGFLGGTVTYFVQGLISIDTVSLRLAFWTLIAGVAVETGKTRTDPKRSEERRGWGRFAGALAALMVTVTAGLWANRFVLADTQMQTGTELGDNNLAGPALEKFRSARALQDLVQYRFVHAVNAGELGVRRGADGAPYIDEMLESFGYLEEVPHPIGFLMQARLLHGWGEKVDPGALVDALGSYQRAIELDPYQPFQRIEASDVLRALGLQDEALAVLEPLIRYRPPQPAFWGAVAVAAAQLGDDELATDAARIALEVDPAEERALEALEVLEGG